ncbi:hypothetical protein KY346_03970 [Candidatus Woesearchaeota archaeon]|nr:hypothetical protein [Candidatus Woesearchaeota archaeon]
MSRAKGKCYLLKVEDPENIYKMAGFIKRAPQSQIVALDTNIVPTISNRDLRDTTTAHLKQILNFTSVLKNCVRYNDPSKFIITKDVRQEIDTSLDFYVSDAFVTEAHAGIKSKAVLKEMLTAYRELREALHQRLDGYDKADAFYTPVKDIVRKLVQDIPRLKKDKRNGENEVDEKMVAYAFAQAIKQDEGLCILSNDSDVVKITQALFCALTARNTVGGNAAGEDYITKSAKTLRTKNVEVRYFDEEKQLFTDEFNGRTDFTVGEHWQPLAGLDYSTRDLEDLIKFIKLKVLDIERELGNGKVLAADIQIQKELDEEKAAAQPAPAPAKNLTPAPEDDAKPEEKDTQDITEVVERMYQRLKINPDDLKSAEQEKINEIVEAYEDILKLYEHTGIDTAEIKQELVEIKKKSPKYQLDLLAEEYAQVEQRIQDMQQDPEHMRDPSKRNLMTTWYAELDSLDRQKVEYKQRIESGPTGPVPPAPPAGEINSLDDLSPEAKAAYDAFDKKGIIISKDGAWVTKQEIADAMDYSLATVANKIAEISNIDVKTKSGEKGKKYYNIMLKHIQGLLPKKKGRRK